MKTAFTKHSLLSVKSQRYLIFNVWTLIVQVVYLFSNEHFRIGKSKIIILSLSRILSGHFITTTVGEPTKVPHKSIMGPPNPNDLAKGIHMPRQIDVFQLRICRCSHASIRHNVIFLSDDILITSSPWTLLPWEMRTIFWVSLSIYMRVD